MLVELMFTNEGTLPIMEGRPVYLAIDDDTGHNYLRRLLPHVDFSELAPGEPLTFSDHLLVGAFRPGHYTIELWIPDPDPSLKFKSVHNFLVSSEGVGNPTTRLNILAEFTVGH
jgi:hypothetical protein